MWKKKLDQRLLLLVHSLGFSAIGGAIFLQILTFYDIANRGYFLAVENNKAILATELVLTAFTLVYFVYLYQRFVRSMR